MTLSLPDRQLLDVAGETTSAGGRLDRIRDLGLTETSYAMRLNVLLDTADALAYAPVLVNRLRRLRASGRRPPSPRSAA